MRPSAFFALFALAAAVSGSALAADVPAPATAPVPAGAYTVDKLHTSLIFRVSHLGFSTYTGRFTRLDADLQFDPANLAASRVNVTIDPRSIEADNAPSGFLQTLAGPSCWKPATTAATPATPTSRRRASASPRRASSPARTSVSAWEFPPREPPWVSATKSRSRWRASSRVRPRGSQPDNGSENRLRGAPGRAGSQPALFICRRTAFVGPLLRSRPTDPA
jgi:hypothetical protein